MSFVCLKSDVAEGEWKTFNSFGEELIVTRQDGQFIVAKNSCKHRGFKVASGCGKGSIKCQYHGQRFGFEKKIKHYEFGDFIYSPGYLGNSEPLKMISEYIGDQFGSTELYVKAPFHLWMQNTADPNHLTTIHKKNFANLFDSHIPGDVYVSEFESSFTMRIKDETIEKYEKYCDKNSPYFKAGWSHYLGFPNLSVTSFLGLFFSVETAEPIPQGCIVKTRFFTAKNSKVPSLLKTLAMDANKKILVEDQDLVEKWAVNYKYTDDCVWLPGEQRIRAYAKEISSRGLC